MTRFFAPIRFCLLLCLALAASSGLTAQTMNGTVTLEARRLLPEDQDILREIPLRLEDYINNRRWTGENEAIRVNLRIGLIIETMTNRGGERLYRGQFQITSPSGENYVDKSYEFPYQRGQQLEENRSLFDPLLSLIDYYVYMVIAGELDCYILQGGTQYYNRSKNIADEGLVSRYASGWRTRLDEVQQILNADHMPLRETKFYFYEGLFYREVRQDAQRVPQYADKVVQLLNRTYQRSPNSTAMKRFLDAHFQEFCELFAYDEDGANAQQMMNIDNRHSEAYEACAGGGRRQNLR